jgi:hypothetical protein
VSLARKKPEVFAHLLVRIIPKEVAVAGSLDLNIDYQARLDAARKRAKEALNDAR